MNPEIKISTRSRHRWIDRLKPVVLIAVLYFVLNMLGAGCPIKFFTGISCPGCGMTRAVSAALRLQFNEAFYYHPLFFLVPLMFAFYMFGEYLNPLFAKYLWAVIIIAFIMVYFLRLIFFYSEVVAIDLNNGIMIRYLKYFIKLMGVEI